MDIGFSHGEAGYHEARELKAMVRFVVNNTVAGTHDRQLLDRMERAADAQLARPEFAELRDREPQPVDDRRIASRVRAWWRELVGPTRRELDLAHQRIDALARAERAERSAFEALAETARVGRERDEALARLQALEAQLQVRGAGADQDGASAK